MSDLMRQIPFGELIDWALCEYKSKGSVFGVRKLYSVGDSKHYSIFGESLELPFGPAAGPHTQLAQNLVASYVSGARFFELKTVQILDGEDLPVSKPCISAKDECYNVEWSTELYVPQALEEYVKGWLAIKVLSRELGLGSDKGFIFNMSVGYDLDGIKTEKINNFIEGLKNADNTESFKFCMEWLYENLHKFEYVDKLMLDSIGSKICDSITLSTLHGCPPAEIERIASYLLKEKKLHTFIKCNPTLLGYEFARSTLDKIGFEYIDFDDTHFKADLQFDDAVPMLQRLQALADGLSLEFGVKLTNTFPVRISAGELPGQEMYMSGRSLFPLSIEVANRLSKAFDGKLRISFSGGADVRNICDILDAGIMPITLATTVLKPGGYQRFHQIAERVSECNSAEFTKIDLSKLQELVNKSTVDSMYHKPAGQVPSRKIDEKVPLTDCFITPCTTGCPFEQDVPAYLRLASEGKYLDALRVITERNPLPFITGTICSHRCMTKCTRFFYDHSVGIRSVKLKAAINAYDDLMSEIRSTVKSTDSQTPLKTDKKTAIIGGGPAGLAAAYFLAREGVPVTIFEKRDSLGGIVRHVIPEFRIHDSAILNDIALVEAMGVEVRLNTEVSCVNMLRNDGFKNIIIATGAWAPGIVELKNGTALDALEFLAHLKYDSRQDKSIISDRTFGKNIAVIGGGNTAMDTARAAKRIPGVENVSIIYRRTKRFMPADAEELVLAHNEGVAFYELLSPKSHQNGALTCVQMELGKPDESGRRSPVPTDKTVEIPADTIIAAVGNKACKELSSIEADDIYVIGDALNGPATVAEAIRDAANCAKEICDISFDKYAGLNISDDLPAVYDKKGTLLCDSSEICQSERCLECKTICENCVDVCPNRANISIKVNGKPQIVHIDFMCNECGNCEAFCPYDSAPYLEKLTLFISEDDFIDSKNQGFIPLPDGSVRIRLGNTITEHKSGENLPPDIWNIIKEVITLMREWVGY